MILEDFKYDHPDRDVAAFKRAVANKLIYAVGKDPATASQDDWLHATAFAVRDQLVERWMTTTRAQYAQTLKRVYYLSMEFLIGRTFTNALLALELQDTVKHALADFGIDLEQLTEREPDAALGNGGLGRLAACFLDSMATLGVPGFGYGIRYEYGMFRQRIVDGQQVETPDYWLTRGNPWEFQRPEVTYRVRFGGHVQRREGKSAPYGAAKWVDTHDVLAMAYDTIIPGYGTQATNTLRLWSARASEEIRVSRQRLIVRRVTANGHASVTEINPYWARIELHRWPPFGITRMAITSHGRAFPIGSFLGAKERERLAAALSAALAQARAAPLSS